jgi:2-phosphosulfolactate phosphatase
MLDVELAFLPSLLETKDARLSIVVDVLRATSTITTLLMNECTGVIPVCTNMQALALRQELKSKISSKILLCGEDSIGILNKEFDLYNSPNKLAQEKYANSIIIMKSTSGTKLLHSLKSSQELLIACALNISSCAKRAVDKAKQMDTKITIMCSGSHGNTKITVEDVVCAGLLLQQIQKEDKLKLNDSAKLAIKLSQNCNNQETLKNYFEESDTGIRLSLAGEFSDVVYCSQVDISQIVPAKVNPPEEIRDVLFIGNPELP